MFENEIFATISVSIIKWNCQKKFVNIYCILIFATISVSIIGGDGTQMRILTMPQTFQRPIGGNISFPCSVLNLGRIFWISQKHTGCPLGKHFKLTVQGS